MVEEFSEGRSAVGTTSLFTIESIQRLVGKESYGTYSVAPTRTLHTHTYVWQRLGCHSNMVKTNGKVGGKHNYTDVSRQLHSPLVVAV